MTGRIEKTVFISYRRTNLSWALAIYQHLTSQGYDVFFDYLSIPSGDFENIIVENIKGRAHFVVILTPSALERCHEPGDWLRREIETAINEKRNIIPLMLESFDFGSPTTVNALTGKLDNLKKYNALRVPSEYFFEAMDRLREQYLNVTLEAVLHPISELTRRATEDQQAAASKAAPVETEQLTAQEWFERGYNLYKNKEEKIRCYTEAIRLAPNFWEAYYFRGAARRDKGDLDGAIQDYAEADRLKPNNPDNIEAYRTIIDIEKNNTFFEEEDIQDYYKEDLIKHESGRLHWLRGETRCEEGDFDGAITDYNEAIRLRPDFTYTYLRRGIAYRRKGDLDRAIADYSKAIDIEPDDAAAYYERGITQRFKGELNNALEDFTKALFIKPDHAMARIALFSLLRKLRREAEAREHEQILRILILKEDEYNRGCFEAICGNTDRALELLKVGLKKGQSSKEWARQDPDFESISDDPRFKELVGE
jgi:tetratricopeptide (TPR) repeat protein